ncbi:DUF6941 family protein [Sphingobium sp. KCTC 72723]|uniref:DUF6941 family protein n=1 Tax=Sphingobium sp. KCTC 72723 TaxID=2733867 RepID=UPI00165D321B|nr:hypothetical protein [Sphingobium sp. KCTC 72723]
MIPGVQAVSIFCEDLRAELGNKESLVGALPSNIGMPAFPAAVTKFCIYTRITLLAGAKLELFDLIMITPNGQSMFLSKLEQAVIDECQSAMLKYGDPTGSIVMRVIGEPFVFPVPGHYSVVLRGSHGDLLTGSINFLTV